MVQDRHSYNGRQIGNHIMVYWVDGCQWPWVSLKVTCCLKLL